MAIAAVSRRAALGMTTSFISSVTLVP
jgi:hypothetical protein